MSGSRPPLSPGPRLIAGSSASGRGRPPVSPRSPGTVPHHGASPSSPAPGMAVRTGDLGSPDRYRAGRRDFPVESAGGGGGSSALELDLSGPLQPPPPPAPLRSSAPPRPDGARDTAGERTCEVRRPSETGGGGNLHIAITCLPPASPPWTDCRPLNLAVGADCRRRPIIFL